MLIAFVALLALTGCGPTTSSSDALSSTPAWDDAPSVDQTLSTQSQVQGTPSPSATTKASLTSYATVQSTSQAASPSHTASRTTQPTSPTKPGAPSRSTAPQATAQVATRMTSIRNTHFVSGPVQTEFGAQIDGCVKAPQESVALARDLGFAWIKQQVRWGDIENTDSRVRWGCLDRVVEAVSTAHLKLLVSVTTAPAHRRTLRDTLGPPDHYEDLAYFLQAMFARYPGRIHAIECWNEPNLWSEWHAAINGPGYGQLLALCALATRAFAPEVMVISAGVAPTDDDSIWTHVGDVPFLKRLFAYGGLNFLDCVGAHANGPDSVGELNLIAPRYAALTGHTRPVCFTEFGYALPVHGQVPKDFAWVMTHAEGSQTKWLIQAMTYARDSGLVRLAVLFNLDIESGGEGANALYALVRSGDGWASPSLPELKSFLKGGQ